MARGVHQRERGRVCATVSRPASSQLVVFTARSCSQLPVGLGNYNPGDESRALGELTKRAWGGMWEGYVLAGYVRAASGAPR